MTTLNTLADILLKLSIILKSARHSTSNGTGSTTTLVDSRMTIEPDNFFNGGTIWFKSGALDGKTAVITDFDSSSGTFTFPTQTAIVASGISYSVASPMYSREDLVSAINQALTTLGPLPTIYDDVAFITVADQEEYTLPTGVCNIKKVLIATSLVAPYNYSENNGWFENNGSLFFDMDIPSTADFLIRLYYEAPHAEVNLDADAITDALHPDLVIWTAAVNALLNRAGVAENSEPFTKEMLAFAQQQRQIMTIRHKVNHWQRPSRLSGW